MHGWSVHSRLFPFRALPLTRWEAGQTYVDELEFANCPDDHIKGFKVCMYVCMYVCVCLFLW